MSIVERLSLFQRLLLYYILVRKPGSIEEFVHSAEVVLFSECPLSEVTLYIKSTCSLV